MYNPYVSREIQPQRRIGHFAYKYRSALLNPKPDSKAENIPLPVSSTDRHGTIHADTATSFSLFSEFSQI